MKSRHFDPDKEFQIMHITIKATGRGHGSDRWIFSGQSKKALIEELQKFLALFSPLKLLAFTQMSSHIHIMLKIPRDYKVSRSEVAQNYFKCYGKKIHPNSHSCQKLQKELNNLSCFMQRFAWHFSYNFNRQRTFKRTGHLWGRPFHDTEIGDSTALLKCWVYVMFNPVKAKMTDNPLKYKFNSLTYADEKLRNETLQNLFEIYKQLSGDDQMILEEFKSMLLAILQTELDEWMGKTEVEREQYREQNHFWDRGRYVDKSHFAT